ncbi:50S ribosomal protein L18 [Candidatus Trichorickettsia mobilis]|uniref:50S ribosomal protein L18 n=1 Tax=Candidatus Trichorickettsia mobilis TaxID=1346319 RepID=UPI002930DF8D|nr:50S ribosomal protein L18 [Candidatus Trichorickettsia mobilis]
MRNSKVRFEIRKNRVRTKISKVSDRIRLSIFKSGKHIYAQVIDDVNSVTLASASTLDKEIRRAGKSNCNVNSASLVGELIAVKAKKIGVNKVVFDKGGCKYHGVVKALADAARKNLEF